MAQPPMISLNDVRLSFGGAPLFEGVSFALAKGERAALVGRNGAGKSTLMKILSGTAEPDSGQVWRQPGISCSQLAQEPDLSGHSTVLDYVAAGLEAAYLAESELMEFGIDPAARPATLSGGQLRRAALARAFAMNPSVLLLDEPTNHLDIPMIEYLESRLRTFAGVVLLVSHDRRFLENVSTGTLWLRQGKVLKSPQGYAAFDEWAGQIEAEEEQQMRRMTTHLKEEQHWLARGVTARRKRNQGRLARLGELKAEHARMRTALGDRRASANLTADTGEVMSRKLIEARMISKTFRSVSGDDIAIARDFSLRVLRGDRIGIIGPNGAGKTSLVRLLLGEDEPDAGTLQKAATLEVTYLDQTRARLDPTDTIWEALAPDGGDSIMVQGRQRHVAAYARDFLFRPEQLRQPVGALSGGERNRLTLAIGLARSANLLVMDEPTNDLDMQTLEILEDMLLSYEGTLILVSHDRAFLDATVTSCLSPLGDGRWVQTAGGWSDAQSQLKELPGRAPRPSPSPVRAAPPPAPRAKPAGRLSYRHEHRQKVLDGLIPELEGEIARLEEALSDPELYARDPDRFNRLSVRIGQARDELGSAETEWLEIEAIRSGEQA